MKYKTNECQCSCNECGAECEPFYKTNKTIIDGIDVSECKKFLAPNGCDSSDTMSMECERNSNCYFKQLKEKDQECEKLKKQYNCHACGTCNGKEDYKNMHRHCEKAIAQIHKCQQALDEIKGLSQSVLDEFENDDEGQQLLYCKQISEQILDIIGKAKEQ